MKRSCLILIICLITAYSFSDYTLTRGPNPGEIYFIGLTNTGEGIYYSTDFGETATCQDFGSLFYGSICADKTEGVLYLSDFFNALYVSTNYGITGSWENRNGGMYSGICGSRIEGELYNIFVSHSEDFGYAFLPHSYNGFFGNFKECEIDNQLNIGYILTYKSNVADSVYLLKSIDNYENLFQLKIFEFHLNDAIELARGTNNGELFLFNHTRGIIMMSNDFASTWDTISTVNFSNIYGLGLTGGRSDGEIYILYNFVNMAWNNAHTYIYHSTNYGKTFEVFHPFAKGNEPVLANFSTIDKEVLLTTPIEFSNFSIGDIQEYQWDFENDGIIDSYDEFPIHIYQDKGYYSVSLTAVGQDSSNTFVKENYIHVIDTATHIKKIDYSGIKIFPNPFTDQLTIEVSDVTKFNRIEIFNNRGEIVYIIDPAGQTNVWDGRDNAGHKCTPGIYYLKIHHNVYKVILTK